MPSNPNPNPNPNHSYGLATRSIHAGEAPDPSTGALGVPLYANTTYAFRSAAQLEAALAGEAPHWFYAREGSPTARTLELKLADLEGAEDALLTGSGMAAIAAALLALVPAGAHLVASADVYDYTKALLCEDLPARGASVTLADFADPAAVAAACTPATRALFCESVSNPALRVADLAGAGAVARERGVPLVVDNTFLSPALLRPLEHGAEVVIHSATKYLSGHGNTLGGVVAGRRDLVAGLRAVLLRQGGAAHPFAAWLLLAGVKTLPLRVARHSGTARRLARRLAAHPAVAAVHYPGLPTDPGHALARGLLGDGEDRYGGMLALRLRGGPAARAAFLDGLRLCTLAVSLGECATLAWPFAGRDLVRLSVGLEDPEDLEADLLGALGGVAERL